MLDMVALEKNEKLSESEYNKTTKVLCDALDGLRVPAIRKGLMFKPHEYEKYEKEAIENFDRKHRPIPDPDLAFDFATIPISLKTSFDITYFPDLYREYTGPDALRHLVAEEEGEDGMVVLPANKFHALILASHQLEQEIRARYGKTKLAKEISPTVEIECTWLSPARFMLEYGDHLTLVVTFFLLPE